MLHERIAESEDRWQEMWAREIETITTLADELETHPASGEPAPHGEPAV